MKKQKAKPAPKTWSENVGVKGVCRVRVFERRPGGPLYVEWKDSRRKKRQEALRIGGRAVLDQQIALRIALSMSQALLDKGHDKVRDALGIKQPRTLQELLAELHEARSPRWKPSYRESQARFRAEWLDWLGGETLLSEVQANEVNKILNRQQEVHGWTPRTRNSRARYLVDAFIFAQTTLKWITEEGNLSAVTFLPLDQEGFTYEEWELDLLNQVVYDIDLRLAVAFRSGHGTEN